MLSVKAREAADSIFKAFGNPTENQTQSTSFAGERSNPRPRIWQDIFHVSQKNISSKRLCLVNWVQFFDVSLI